MTEVEKIVLVMRKQADYFIRESKDLGRAQATVGETSASLLRAVADDIESGDYVKCLDAGIFDE